MRLQHQIPHYRRHLQQQLPVRLWQIQHHLFPFTSIERLQRRLAETGNISGHIGLDGRTNNQSIISSILGVSAIRVANSGRALPSARLISTTVVVNDTIPDPRVTLMAMQWGQFLDHDLTLTPTFTKSQLNSSCLVLLSSYYS